MCSWITWYDSDMMFHYLLLHYVFAIMTYFYVTTAQPSRNLHWSNSTVKSPSLANLHTCTNNVLYRVGTWPRPFLVHTFTLLAPSNQKNSSAFLRLLTFLKNMYLSKKYSLIQVCLMFPCCLCIWDKISWKWCCVLLHVPCLGHPTLICPITSDGNFITS